MESKKDFTMFQDLANAKDTPRSTAQIKRDILGAKIAGLFKRVFFFYVKFTRIFNIVEPFFRIVAYCYLVYKMFH